MYSQGIKLIILNCFANLELQKEYTSSGEPTDKAVVYSCYHTLLSTDETVIKVKEKYARELMKVLSYKDWRYFYAVIEKAKIACQNSEITDIDHFVVDNKMVEIGSNAKREQKDYKLTRYACYLIAQNANPRLKIVALAQTYFAIQTRKQEISEKEYTSLTEDEKRFYQRNLTRKGNYSLNQTAKNAGVKNFDKFHNAGYKGLYNGETADDIAKRKGLRYREDILDNMGSEELAANLFRITQTESRLKRDKVDTEKKACDTHNKIGKIVRKAIKQAGRNYARRIAYT